MKIWKQGFLLTLCIALAVSLCACTSGEDSAATTTAQETGQEVSAATASTEEEYTATQTSSATGGLAFDNSAWNYNTDDDVYWQVGAVYCADPVATEYESLGVFVPGAYMEATDNGDGTYTCALSDAAVGGYTAATAPIVMPVNTPGYSAQAAPTDYSSDAASYTAEGFVYVSAGCQGRDSGAPWGVTDLKAAVRYLRYNDDVLPGDTEHIFTFGMSGGGAQSALMGATGDSELYTPYLEQIGAATEDANGNAISDAVFGAMCWCPITSLDYADEAYEWNMGQYADTGTRAEGTWTSAFSGDLSTAYATYLNQLGLVDETGAVLTLEESQTGIYNAGSYYDYLLAQIELSLNNFLSDTQFPYTPSSGMGGGGMPQGDLPSGDLPSGDMPSGEMPGGAPDVATQATDSTSAESSVTYETAQDYIDSLNADGTWITYDAASNTATITSIGDFVVNCKNASKDVGAFDDLNRAQAENTLFGTPETGALHFDPTMASLLQTNEASYAALSDWDASYVTAYQEDLTMPDALGNGIDYRQNTYNPMYYLMESYDGYGSSTPAAHWRIRTGINQGDTALTVETNLALALQQNDSVQDVDFAMVWGQGHTTAERTGDSTANFIEWVNACCA